jgi:hypothetical protein
MKAIHQHQQRSQTSSVERTESGFYVDRSVLPANGLTQEMRVNETARFWNRLDRLAKNLGGLTQRTYRNLTKSERDELRAVVLAHYNLKNQQFSKRWVYIITHPLFPGACKVGISTNVRRRLAQYQVGCPLRRYRLEYAREYQDINSTIDEVYKRLDGSRLRGEWFEVSSNDVVDMLTELSQECA